MARRPCGVELTAPTNGVPLLEDPCTYPKLLTPLVVTASVAALALSLGRSGRRSQRQPPQSALKAFAGKHAKAHVQTKASVTTLTDQVFGPFNLDIRGGKVLVADGFTGAGVPGQPQRQPEHGRDVAVRRRRRAGCRERRRRARLDRQCPHRPAVRQR